MPDFPIPLLPGPWRALTPGHAAGFTMRLRKLLARPRSHDHLSPHHPIEALRAMPLSFYPGWALIEGEARVARGRIGTFDVLYGPGLMWVIDGESRVLNDLNGGRLPADLAEYFEGETGDSGYLPSPLAPLDAVRSGPDYLRFYCACVWGDEGPFMPVESLDSPVLRGAALQRDVPWADKVRPIGMTRDGEDLLATGLIAYGGSLFEARLRIREGGVTMEDDTLVASDAVPLRANASPLRDLRDVSEIGDLPESED